MLAVFGLLAGGAALATACVIPNLVIPTNITTGFAVQIQNPAFPAIHDFFLDLYPAGGGDMHLFITGTPQVGTRYSSLTLSQGVLTDSVDGIHAVIDGQVSHEMGEPAPREEPVG